MHKYQSRHSFIAIILILYFIPLFVMGSYSLRWLSLAQSWNMISLSALLAICGSIAIYGYLYRWEREKKPEEVVISQPVAPTFEAEYNELQADFAQQNEELRTLQDEMERYRKLWEDLDNEKVVFKESLEEQLVEKNRLLTEYEEANASLKQELEITQQKNEELEIKVNDLSYEIKTLLQLSELDESLKEDPFEDPTPIYKTPEVEIPLPPTKIIRNPEEASVQLKRCLDIAQKITGASHYQNFEGRYQSLPANHTALDLRHLFDNLRSEHGASILFYSHKEQRLLFANNQIKTLLGWSPEKVIQDFSELTVEGSEDWKKATEQSKNEGPLSLMMKTKTGEILEIKALIGIIPSGVFRQDLIVVLYPK